MQERVRREPGTQNACPTCKTAPFIGTDIAALLSIFKKFNVLRLEVRTGWLIILKLMSILKNFGNFLNHLIFLEAVYIDFGL